MINCLKDSIHVLMSVLLSTSDDDDDDHEEVVGHEVRGDEDDVVADAKEEDSQFGCNNETIIQKSSLRKADKRESKKKVQWVDMIGKKLAEIREFEPSEEDNIDSDRGKACVCVIL